MVDKSTSAFISRWGELGRAWGMPRGAAQVHALLIAADEPMDAETIAARLGIARSNVSTSLRDLRAQGVIRMAQSAPGSRRELFVALDDPFEAAARIAAYRKARELDPATSALRIAAKAAPKGAGRSRLAAYADLAEATGDWAEDMSALPKGPLKMMLKIGARIADLLPQKKKKKKD